MEKNDIIRFLQGVDEQLAKHASEGETLDLFLLGRAALIIRYGVALATKDIDVVTRGESPPLEEQAFRMFGKATKNAQAYGLYLEAVPVGLPPVPGGYRERSVAIEGPWNVLRPKLLDVHDLAITKIRRFHAGDRDDLRILCDSGDINKEALLTALDAAYPFGMDAEEDPSHKRVKENIGKVVSYLEGRITAL